MEHGVTRELAARLIAEQRDLLARYEHLLDREAAALRTDDVAAIEGAGADRQECSSELLRVDEERRQACRMLGYGDGGDAFERLLADCDPGGELARNWQSLHDVLVRCKHANDRNGAVVTAKLRRVEALLTMLRGGDAGAQVYQAGGQARPAARSLSLGLA
jgi:flagellar biosynthesis/type III secretory pathway chaperone